MKSTHGKIIDRGTTEAIYTVKRIQQISNRKKQPLFLLFVDLSAAFDHIPRKWLFESIRLRFNTGQSLHLFDIMEKLYSNTTFTFEEANETFKTTSGVRQGGPESPFLFKLFIDFVMRVFIENSEGIDFYQHKYRVDAKSFMRTERYELRSKGIALNGTLSLMFTSSNISDLTSMQKNQIPVTSKPITKSNHRIQTATSKFADNADNQLERLNATYHSFLKRMVRNGQKHVDKSNNDYRMAINNNQLHAICGTKDIGIFVKVQQQKYMAHIICMNIERNAKKLTFNDEKYTKKGRPVKSLLDQVIGE